MRWYSTASWSGRTVELRSSAAPKILSVNRELRRRRAEITMQLELLDSTIIALRASVDPAGQYL